MQHFVSLIYILIAIGPTMFFSMLSYMFFSVLPYIVIPVLTYMFLILFFDILINIVWEYSLALVKNLKKIMPKLNTKEEDKSMVIVHVIRIIISWGFRGIFRSPRGCKTKSSIAAFENQPIGARYFFSSFGSLALVLLLGSIDNLKFNTMVSEIVGYKITPGFICLTLLIVYLIFVVTRAGQILEIYVSLLSNHPLVSYISPARWRKMTNYQDYVMDTTENQKKKLKNEENYRPFAEFILGLARVITVFIYIFFTFIGLVPVFFPLITSIIILLNYVYSIDYGNPYISFWDVLLRIVDDGSLMEYPQTFIAFGMLVSLFRKAIKLNKIIFDVEENRVESFYNSIKNIKIKEFYLDKLEDKLKNLGSNLNKTFYNIFSLDFWKNFEINFNNFFYAMFNLEKLKYIYENLSKFIINIDFSIDELVSFSKYSGIFTSLIISSFSLIKWIISWFPW